MVSSTVGSGTMHRLEAPLQRRIFLDMLAVFVQRGRADDMQLARARGGFSMLLASMAPSAAPAPTMVCSSSMKVMYCPDSRSAPSPPP